VPVLVDTRRWSVSCVVSRPRESCRCYRVTAT